MGTKQRRRRRVEAVLLQCLVRLCVFCVELGASVPAQHRSCKCGCREVMFQSREPAADLGKVKRHEETGKEHSLS